jgi:hypothetical protein
VTATRNDRSNAPTSIQRVLVVVGFLGFLGAGLFYLGSGLVVPGLWVVPLWAIWIAGLWVMVRLAQRWSWWTLATGPVAFGIWWLYVTAGDIFLNWTA